MDKLINCNCFQVEELGVKVNGDERLRIKECLLARIPEDVTREDLEHASELISEYFSTIVEFLEYTERMKVDIPD